MNIVASNTNHLLRGNGGSSPVEYTAGPNINITNRVISGKYWDNEIAQAAADASAAAVNSAYDKTTAWVDSQNYLTAHQDVSNLPYVKNSSLDYTTDGQVSSISGSGLYAVSADNAANADHADNATHADSADNALTAQFAFSSNSSLNSELANVASTAMTANFLEGGWQYDQFGFITAYNNSSFSNNGGGGGGVYQGIAPISVDNNAMVISADSAALGVQAPLYFVEDSVSATIIGIDSAVIPTFQLTNDGRVSSINNSALYGAGGGTATAYVGGDNIGIVNDVISVTGSVPSADTASYAISADSADKANSATNADSANFATESNHSLSSDSATYDNLGREITATYLTAHQALPDWGPDISAASSNAYNSATAWVDSQNYLTAVTGDTTPYSAGANIDITNHVVSGKDWNNDITAAANSAFTAATALIPTALTGNYVQSTALNVTSIDGNTVITGISGTGFVAASANTTQYATYATGAGTASTAMTANALVASASAWMDVTEYSAGPNINIDHHIISGKSWTNDINAASSYAFNLATASVPAAKVYDVKAGSNVSVTTATANTGSTYTVSGKSWTTEINNASSYAYNQSTAYADTRLPPTIPLQAGPNIGLYLSASKVTISAEAYNNFYTGTISDYNNGYAGFTFNDMSFSYHYSDIMPSASGIGGTWVAKQLNNNNYEISFNMYGMAPWVTAQWEEKANVLVAQHAFVRRAGIIEMWKEWDPNNSYRIDRVVSYPTGDNWTTFGHVQINNAATGGDNNPWHLNAILEVEKTN
jgi:hypothetical protein